MAEEKSVGHGHASCGNCQKIKDSQCEETRKALEECRKAREEAEAAAQESLQQELEEAKAKNKSLQKTIAAFQIATTVGVTLLGQEVFNKIMDKVNSVKEVQAKITGDTGKATEEKQDTKGKTDGKKSVTFRGDTSNIMTIARWESIGSLMAQRIPPVNITEKQEDSFTETAQAITMAHTRILDEQGIGLTLLPPSTKQQVATSTVDWSQYIYTNTTPPIEAVTMTWGGDLDSWGDGAGAYYGLSAAPVPAPNGITVFALSLINSPRRRA